MIMWTDIAKFSVFLSVAEGSLVGELQPKEDSPLSARAKYIDIQYFFVFFSSTS